jgi:metal-responsive CopG/Arc/MetJ family transcriptional regulator
MKKGSNPNFSRIWLLIPKTFLKHFDEAVQSTFPSRSEAIRRGMNLVLEEIRQFKPHEEKSAEPPMSPSEQHAQAEAIIQTAEAGGFELRNQEKREEASNNAEQSGNIV